MRHISAHLRRFVMLRSGKRCEYCQLSQAGQEATFHIDHITPIAAGGETVADNLALACVSCSLRKSAKQTAVDSETKTKFLCSIRAAMSGRSISSGTVCDLSESPQPDEPRLKLWL